jgi:large subunit ribosomal protein L10
MNESILEAKKATVDRLSKELSKAQCAIIVTYHNLDVYAITGLRKDLKKNGGKMEVAKNTLMKRALDDENFKSLDALLKGPNAVLTGSTETGIISIVENFVAVHPDMEIKGAVIGNVFCDADTIRKLAFVKSKEDALSMLVSALSTPVRSFACALKAYADKQQPAAAK